MTVDLHDISPELVLVDPELAAVARLHLPEPGSFGRRPETASVEVKKSESRSGRHRWWLSQPLILLVFVGVVGSALFLGRAMSSVPRPWLSQTAADGAVQTISWPRIAGATYYDLVVWQDGRRVLDLWPTAAAVSVPLNASDRSGDLGAGHYLWFAYPGFGAKSSRHYGALAGSGDFVVHQRGKSEVTDLSSADGGPGAPHRSSGGG